MKETRIFGKIFLPESPNEVINGVWLNISRGSIYLEIPHHSLSNQEWKIILGEFNGLDKVTFVSAFAGAGSTGSGGTWRKVIVSYLIKGSHINQISELTFSKTTLVSPSLSNWLIEPDGIQRLEKNTYQIPEKKTIFSIPLDETTISLDITYCHKYSSQSLSIVKKSIFTIESSTEIHIDRISEMMIIIKKWILFITNKNPEFSEYYLVNSNCNSLELVNTLDDLDENRFTQNLSLSYSNLKSSLSQVFQNWVTNKNLVAVIDLIQEKNYNTKMSFQGYFLNMCVAVEYFHDQFILEKNKELINERKEKRKLISDLIKDDDLNKWFRKTSKYWEKADLRDRLMAYKEPISKIMGDTFGFTIDELIDKVLKTRNSMAHDGSYDKHLTHIELFLVGKVIEFTLKYEILNLLKYIPIRESKVLEDAKRHVEILANLNEYNKTTA